MAKFERADKCFHASETIGWLNAVTVKAFIRPTGTGNGTGYTYFVSATCAGQQRWTVSTLKDICLATAKRRCSELLKSGYKPKLKKGEF